MAQLASGQNQPKVESNPLVREAVSSDLPSLIDLYAQSDEYHYRGDPEFFCVPPQPPRSTSYLREVISSEDRVILVVQEHDELLGLLEMRLNDFVEVSHTYPRRVAFMVTVFLKKKARELGYGNQLIDAGIDWAKVHGAFEIGGDVYSFNQASLQFFIERKQAKIRYYHIYFPIQDATQSPWRPIKVSKLRKVVRKAKRLLGSWL